MTADKIAEIRARHEEIDAWVKETRTFGPTAAHTDRATLLAEVERLRAALPYDWDMLQSCRESLREHMVECKRLIRERDEARAEAERLRDVLKIVRIDGPDLDGLVWVSFVSQGMPARAHVVVGDKSLMVSRLALQFRGVQRKALEGAP